MCLFCFIQILRNEMSKKMQKCMFRAKIRHSIGQVSIEIDRGVKAKMVSKVQSIEGSRVGNYNG